MNNLEPDYSKMNSDDRILVLTTIDGNQRTNTGVLDTRLFTGETKLHAKRVLGTNLWALNYDKGILPQPLKQKFTSFNRLHDFCSEYFFRRNIKIKEIIDVHPNSDS